MLESIVDKIVNDMASGIIIVPVWKEKMWFHLLGNIAITWFDLPTNTNVFQTSSGDPIPQRRGCPLRVVVFNAFGYSEDSYQHHEWQDCHPMGFQEFRESTPTDAIRKLTPIDWECPTQSDLCMLRSVIASASQHPDAQRYADRIMKEFHHELHEPKLAKDVDPKIRGPFGQAKIKLQKSAKAMPLKPFRTLGER